MWLKVRDWFLITIIYKASISLMERTKETMFLPLWVSSPTLLHHIRHEGHLYSWWPNKTRLKTQHICQCQKSCNNKPNQLLLKVKDSATCAYLTWELFLIPTSWRTASSSSNTLLHERQKFDHTCFLHIPKTPLINFFFFLVIRQEKEGKVKMSSPRNVAMTHVGLLYFVNFLLDQKLQIFQSSWIHDRNIWQDEPERK